MRLKKAALGLVMICLVFSLLFSQVVAVQASENTELISAEFASVEAAVPVGTIIAFAGAVAPKGYLLCDGTTYSRITYENLYAVIGTIYGSTDGNTFKVPDLRGEFLRGVDNGRGIDIGRALGSWQEDMFKKHTHSWLHGVEQDDKLTGGSYNEFTEIPGTTTNVIGETGGSETRPRNVAINYCIKY